MTGPNGVPQPALNPQATVTIAAQPFGLLRDVFFTKRWQSIVLTLGMVACVICGCIVSGSKRSISAASGYGLPANHP